MTQMIIIIIAKAYIHKCKFSCLLLLTSIEALYCICFVFFVFFIIIIILSSLMWTTCCMHLQCICTLFVRELKACLMYLCLLLSLWKIFCGFVQIYIYIFLKKSRTSLLCPVAQMWREHVALVLAVDDRQLEQERKRRMRKRRYIFIGSYSASIV